MKRLIRSKTDRKLAGVIGGLAQYLGMDSSLLRVIYVILAIVTTGFPLVLAYFIMIFIMPNEEDVIRP
ncbi:MULTISPECIES: PspC domain-containing protein [Bacillus]|uniref:PspC domain-containing protein n=1 Tax=Bacillus TaxID=1386 RepID=UPI000BB8294E|nr:MULTISPECIES: PspC domain-containing protein [Bacillus]